MKDFSELLKIIIIMFSLFALFGIKNDYIKNERKINQVMKVGDTLKLNNEKLIITKINYISAEIYLSNGAIVEGDYAIKLKNKEELLK